MKKTLVILILMVLLSCLKTKKSAFDFSSPIGFLWGFGIYFYQLSQQDTTPPVASFQNIKSNGVINSSFILGTATDNVSVASIEISIDNGAFQSISGITPSSSVNWKYQLPVITSKWKENSTHTIATKATDKSGNISSTNSITIRLGKNKDIDGDGYTDLVVGGSGFYPFGIVPAVSGNVYIFYGKASNFSQTSSSQADTIITGNGTQYLGSNFAVGDLNGDGFADIALGAPNDNSVDGAIYIFYGSANRIASTTVAASSSASNVIKGEAGTASRFGFSANIADLDGDGYGDLIVGAQYYNNAIGRGKIYVFYGSSSGVTTPFSTTTANCINFIGENNNDYMAYAITSGDLNNDGYADILTASYNYPSASGNGRLYIIYGSSTRLTSGGATISLSNIITNTNASQDFFGWSLSLGDIDKDNKVDILIGAEAYASNSTGRIYIYYGKNLTHPIGASLTHLNGTSITGDSINSNFGFGIAIGDINGDGFDDLVSSAPSISSNVGKLYLFKGASTGIAQSSSTTADIGIIAGESGFTGRLGTSLIVSDLNGDGIQDIISGAISYGSSQTGKIYIIYGKQSFSWTTGNDITKSDVSITGSSTNNLLGVWLY